MRGWDMRSERPDGWISGKLGDHVELFTGFPFESTYFTQGSDDIRLLRGDNVGQGRLRWNGAQCWPSDACSGLARYEVEPGDVVLAMDRPWIEAGLKFAVARDEDAPSLLVQRVARLRAHGRLQQRYLACLIGGPPFTSYVRSVQTGTAVPHISGAQIAQFPVALPPVAEQARVAEVLSALDDKIDSNRRLGASLEQTVQVSFCRSFGASIEGLEPLGGHITVIRGRSYKSAELAPSDCALVSLKCILRHGGYTEKGLKPYTGAFKPEQIVNPGEIVVAHTDLTQDAAVIGKPALVPDAGPYEKLVASLDLAIVRPASTRISVPFLYHLLLDRAFQQHVYGYANGSTVLHLGKNAITSFSFEPPSPQSLRDFNGLALPLLARAHAVSRETRTLAAIRDALLPKLVSGQIRVPDTTDPDEVIGPVADEPA